MCKIVKYFQSNLKFPFFNLSKNYSTEFFLIFLVSSSVCNVGPPGLVFKIYAIDGKKWVKFVATEQCNLNLGLKHTERYSRELP